MHYIFEKKRKPGKKISINSDDLLIFLEETSAIIVIYGHIFTWYLAFFDVLM